MESTNTTTTEIETNYTLHLQPPPRNVRWSEEVVDNESMNKRKSKSKSYLVCCIYRKPKVNSSSSSSCDSDDDHNEYERP